jgi:hypothetical protein
MFVGDSLNRNQWESMVCFVQSLIPPGRKSLNKTGSLAVFRIEVPLPCSCSLSRDIKQIYGVISLFIFTFTKSFDKIYLIFKYLFTAINDDLS